MKHLILTFALLAAFAASADKIVTRTAPDGVNTVTTHVDDNGYVASERSTLVHVCEKFHDQEAEDDATRQLIQESLEKIAEAHREQVEDGAIVQSVYGEGSNSSFIVKKELTATQKRFLALGRQYMRMAYFANALFERVGELERRLEAHESKRGFSLSEMKGIKFEPVLFDSVASNLQSRVEALEEREAKRQAEIDARRKAAETARAKRKAADDKASADKVQRAIDRAQGGKTAKSRREVR